jgi:hypothetical protein
MGLASSRSSPKRQAQYVGEHNARGRNRLEGSARRRGKNVVLGTGYQKRS